MQPCRQETPVGKLRGSNNVHLCGADGLPRTLRGGLGAVRETLCDFHAQMWIDRGYDVSPRPGREHPSHSLDGDESAHCESAKHKELPLL